MRRDVFQALADPTRRQIVLLIAQQSMTPNTIAEEFHMSRQAVSKHIQVLRECGLIMVVQKGRERYCEIQRQKLSEVEEWLSHFRSSWESRFDKLDSVLLSMKKK